MSTSDGGDEEPITPRAYNSNHQTLLAENALDLAEKRIARLVDSPNLPDGEAVFSVTMRGIKD